MATILRPFSNILSPGSRQVPTGRLQIDWGNPLTRGLIGAFIPGSMYGIDISGHAPTLHPLAGGNLAMTREGFGLDGTVANAGLIATIPNSDSPFRSWTEFTLYWRGYQTSALPGANAAYIDVTYNFPNTGPFVLVDIQGSGAAQVIIWNSGGSLASFTLAFPIVANTMQSWCATYVVNGGANSVLGYRNGIKDANSGNFGALAATSTNTSQIQLVGNGISTNAIQTAGYYWNRALSAYEVMLLEQNPYGFFMPAEGEMTILSVPTIPPSVLYGHNIGGHFSRRITTIGY